MIELLKNLIATRGVQLTARYLATGLSMLATYLHVSATDWTGTSIAIANLFVAGVLATLDHYSHIQQQGK